MGKAQAYLKGGQDLPARVTLCGFYGKGVTVFPFSLWLRQFTEGPTADLWEVFSMLREDLFTGCISLQKVAEKATAKRLALTVERDGTFLRVTLQKHHCATVGRVGLTVTFTQPQNL